MIGIIGAMDVELQAIKNQIANIKEINKGIRIFYTGTIHNKEVVVVLAGIGKVNAGITTSLLCEYFDITSIINIGVAGGLNGVKHGDVVISQEVLYHDVDVTAFGSKYIHGQVPGHTPTFHADANLLNQTKKVLEQNQIPYKIGHIASGDQFVYKLETVQAINAIYDSVFAIEMEAAAIAQVATIYQVPFIVYRSISDVLGDENQGEDFYTFLEKAANNASLVLEQLIEVIE